jgi:segregation and condensation protein B
MNNENVLPEIKQIIGAMLFAAKHPVSAAQMRRVLKQVAESRGGAFADFASVTEGRIGKIIDEIREDLKKNRLGFTVSEVAKGYRYENDVNCGIWVRQLLEKGKANRLSRPSLETLAIIAYRQPCVRSEIEAVRGVACDQVVRNLMEMQLVKIVGRSQLPGRPLLLGTTQKFLEHFGLKTLNDLPGTEELRRMENEQMAKNKTQAEDEESPEEPDEADDDAAEEDDDDES